MMYRNQHPSVIFLLTQWNLISQCRSETGAFTASFAQVIQHGKEPPTATKAPTGRVVQMEEKSVFQKSYC